MNQWTNNIGVCRAHFTHPNWLIRRNFSILDCLFLIKTQYFHQIGPLGRSGLVVTMSVCIYIYICMQFFWRPFIGPQITWLVWGLLLVNPPSLPNLGGGGGVIIIIFFLLKSPLVAAAATVTGRRMPESQNAWGQFRVI